MKLIINGEERELEAARTLSELLANMNVSRAALAIELNGEVLNSTMFDEAELNEGDRIELVRLVGGG